SRITGAENPDLFVMSYSKEEMKVDNLFLVPKHFFVPEIIEKRKPLAETARRAGWTGCNILIDKIPPQGKIDIIKGRTEVSRKEISEKLGISDRLIVKDIKARGWLLDILNCVNSIKTNEFTLDDVYAFTSLLTEKHPNNNNIQPKIRQQLQFLRDKGVIEFTGKGRYRKLI
ncbi:MAG: DpnI domain-containing protein, partial [Clostridia bacterium]|nr:DpnI domain-containing protein [Clostridia bacterium]